jgi:Flp pilus assembly protein TadD
MNSTKLKTLRLGLVLLGSGTALAAVPAAAQVQQNPYREDAGTALTRHLRTLSEQPRSLSALMGAGKAALDLGDPQAALTFFARAEEIAPRDGRVKAGMGSAFIAMEQPRTALRLFSEAAGLGIPEYEFAGDRGLVHDLAGDPRRAQADYSLALSRREDDEVRRRLALSLAISGERDKALATIDAQLRRQDRAAWRTRAFILALAGDARGATQVAQSTMPAQAAELQPFFARLSSLSPAQRAMAVHFGHFPEGAAAQAAGTQYASAAPAIAAPTQAGRPDSGQTALGTRRSQPAPSAAPAQRRTTPAPAPRQRDRQEVRSARAQDWAEAYSRPSVGIPALENLRRRPSSTSRSAQLGETAAFRAQPNQAQALAKAAPPPPAPRPAQTPSPAQTLPLPQPTVQTPAPATASALGSLVQGLPADQPAAPQPTTGTPAESQPIRLAEATPTAPPVAQPVADAPAQQSPESISLPPSSVATSTETPPVNAPAQQTLTLPQQLSADILRPQSSARSFEDIAAAIAALPGDPGAATSAPSSQPERQQLASVEPNVTLVPPAPREEPKLDTPKEAAPATPKPEAPKPAAPKPKEEPPKEATAAKPSAKKEASAKEAPAKEAAAGKAGAKKEAPAKKEAAPREPSRHWVQIAGGANEAAMTTEFNRLKAKAPKLLGGRTAWTTPLRATNRLLVGPFKTPKEAQDFVNELAKLDLSAFSWTSPAGQEIVKLSAK